MKKISSDKSNFLKNIFPFILLGVFGIVATALLVNKIYIALPILIFQFIYIVFRIVFSFSRIVDIYVDYQNKKILIDNLRGKRFQYQFSDLIKMKYVRSGERVKLTFSDRKKFIFFTRKMWALRFIENTDGVEDELQKFREFTSAA